MDKRKLYGEVIDGQDPEKDGHDDGGDQHAEHQDEHGLDQGEKAFDTGFDLAVQYVGQLEHHLADASRLLTHPYQVDRDGLEDAGGGDGLHHLASLLHDGRHLRERLLEHGVVHRLGGDVQGREHRHTVAEQRAQGTGEQRQLVLQGQRPHEGHLQQARLPPHPAGRGSDPAAHEQSEPQHRDADQETVAGEGMAQGHHQLGRQGKRVAHVGEELLELRHDEAQHGDQRQHGHAQQDGRIDGGRDDAVPQGALALHVGDEPFEHGGHLAARLAGADHVDVEVAEQVAVLRERPAEGRAALDGIEHALQQDGHAGLVAHVDEHPQRVVERQAGAQHDGEFRRECKHVRLLDGALAAAPAGRRHHASGSGGCGDAFACAARGGRSDRWRSRGIADAQGRETLVAQLLEDLRLAQRGLPAFDDLAGCGDGAPGVVRHRPGPASRGSVRPAWSRPPPPCAGRPRRG